ncbi:MAG: sulfotransferase domain-containing protein [Alphaproteobacteria bacterium]|nr:sulfotransferase domain-containing protein [Alphaproteobacteria bacterium]
MLIRPARREYRTWTLDSRRWADYKPRPDDIVIATAPKCGTTWTQQIVSSLVFQDAKPRPIPKVSPWIEARFRGFAEDMFANLESQTHRRFIKTHLPIDGLPLHDDVRYIHVARDGRDALMSMHNHFTGFAPGQLENFDQIGLADPVIAQPYPRLPADAAAYFRLWITTPVVPGQTEGIPGPSFFDLEVGYWAERHRANVLLVHYNDLKADLDGEMRRISSFLDIPIDESVWPSLVGAANFEAMQAAGEDLMPQAKTLFSEGTRRFFNKGTNGRWRNVFTESDLALYDAKAREKFSPGLAAWLEGGRHAAGDPRLLPD